MADALRYARWLLRRPHQAVHLLRGVSLRDLVLREDLRRAGRPVSVAGARGLGAARLNVALVDRLARAFPEPPRTILDVGAAHGPFAVAATLAFPGVRVLAFEPLPEVFRVLQAAAARRPGVRAFPFALGGEDGTAPLHVSPNTGSSSIAPMLAAHEEAFPGTAVVREETVEVRRLDSVVREEGLELEPPVLMKIDVQGTEDRVLAGAEATLPRIDALIVEMSLRPLYEGQALEPELRARIEDAGFVRVGRFDEIVAPGSGEVVQVDGLFRRPPK